MRNSTRRTALVLAGAVAASFAAVAPATADTTTTFTIGAGSLYVSQQPDAADLGTVGAGALVVGPKGIGEVTVTDERRVTGEWTASVSSTDFTNGPAPYDAQHTVPATSVVYAAPDTSLTFTGNVVPAPVGGPFLAADAPIEAVVATVVGNNTVTWNPTLAVTLAADDVVGTYTGVVTHSVA